MIFESLGEEKIIWLSIRGNAFLSKGINESLEVLWENKGANANKIISRKLIIYSYYSKPF